MDRPPAQAVDRLMIARIALIAFILALGVMCWLGVLK
jgi:hypothetical protein